MRRMRFEGNLGRPLRIEQSRSRGGAWTRLATLHKACNPQCAVCGDIMNLQSDHIVPLHKGGTSAWSNIQSLCAPCHARKSAQDRLGA
jgi:5-methylcytosine-specific restriction protein A